MKSKRGLITTSLPSTGVRAFSRHIIFDLTFHFVDILAGWQNAVLMNLGASVYLLRFIKSFRHPPKKQRQHILILAVSRLKILYSEITRSVSIFRSNFLCAQSASVRLVHCGERCHCCHSKSQRFSMCPNCAETVKRLSF